MNNYSALSCREQVAYQRDEYVRFVIDQHTYLDFYSVSSLNQQ
jgi:hypothetical protein